MTRRVAGGLSLLALAVPFTLAWLPPTTASAQSLAASRSAVLFLVDRISFEELLSIPQVRGLAGVGGVGLLSSRTPLGELLDGADLAALPLRVVDLGSIEGPNRPDDLRQAGESIASTLEQSLEGEQLAIVATPTPSSAMRSVKDELTGIIVARGPAADLAAATVRPPPDSEALTALTSDSTRRSGVVVSTDVLPTIERFLGGGVPDAAVIVLDPAPAPLELHERYLANRRMSVPVQTGAGIYLAVAGLFAVGALWSGKTGRLRRWAAWAAFSTIPLTTALLLVGHVSPIAYVTVVPILIAATFLGTIAFVRLERDRGPVATLGMAGATVLALFLLESALGWSAALTPFLGGSELDGGRFFGLPNAFIGLVMGASVYVAATLARPLPGALAVGAAALFAGLPWTGSDLGGAIAIFAAAGLWFGIRMSGRLSLQAAAWSVAAAGFGTAVVLAAHRFLASTPTHITRFVEGESGGIVATAARRLEIGFDLIARNPFALIPVLGVPICLLVVLRPPEVLRAAFARRPVWRDAVLTILVGSAVAYLANDSGAAALGLGFATGLVGILYVSLVDPPGMMGS
ncbi:MAG TPA: hypothetical protein VGR41_05600 [Actinomycetota bacterium]|nr:hypothetical protein [Actinomycetota bacterium]